MSNNDLISRSALLKGGTRIMGNIRLPDGRTIRVAGKEIKMDRRLDLKMGTMDNFSDSIKLLNKYRNFHYNAPLGTEENELANAINDILPTFCKLMKNIDQRQAVLIIDDSKHCHCTHCGSKHNIKPRFLGWRYCPVCGAEFQAIVDYSFSVRGSKEASDHAKT